MRLYYTLLFCLLLSFPTLAQPQNRVSFNKGWKFFLGDNASAKNAQFDDSRWRFLNLPHDWSIEGSFSEKNPAKTDGGALPTGIGWYRKSFVVPAASKGKLVSISFDGVYRNAEVWINGSYLGKRPYGYSSFQYDLNSNLKFGEKNVIAVRVDNSEQPNSRWYTGSGIYRNVWLETRERVSVAQWGTFVTTSEVSWQSALVSVKTRLRNLDAPGGKAEVQSTIYNPQGKAVASIKSENVRLGDTYNEISQQVKVDAPQLWSPSDPNLYRLVTTVISNNKVMDSYETPFGIRYFNFDPAKGFSINGKALKILGVCQHHDLGALGAAFNFRAAERQLEILKDMGCNAIRFSHNPPAPELLDLCDKMGFLTMDEAFDMWKKKKNSKDYHMEFAEWSQRDLEDMVKRDRNHPSIIAWSIGNEIREQFDSTGISITRELADIVKRLDTTRPVTSALTENIPEKNMIYQSKALDILGFNYKYEAYGELPDRFPGKSFIATETASAIATRGHYDLPSDSMRIWPKDGKTKFTEGNSDWTASAYDNAFAYWGTTHEISWNAVKKYPFMAGLFVWAGFDYLGEPHPYPWPARSTYFGVIDLAGFPKDTYYMYQSEWSKKPVLHLFPHWNWKPEQMVDVWAYYNNADEVELFLNGKSQGIKKKEGDVLHVMWRIKYQPGTLKIVSRKDMNVVLSREIKTAGKPTKIELVADRSELKANGEDLSFVTVRVLDAEGNLVPNADNLISFKVAGAGLIEGVDNGYQASLEPFKASYRKAYNGMCLAIIKSKDTSGSITLQATSAGLQPANLTIQSK